MQGCNHMSNTNLGKSKNIPSIFYLVLFTVLGFTSCGGGGAKPATTPGLTVTLTSSRSSGVAPLAVFFDASGTTDAGVTGRPFHDLEYHWDFNDPAGGATWANGAQAGVNSKNTATGPVAAHVFETPGTYTITLTVVNGTKTATSNTTITVTDPNTYFATTDTVCVSTSGDFTGCPLNATHAANTPDFAAALANITSSKKRLLFRAGETWAAAASNTISLAGPGYIGSYGAGTAPRIQATSNINMLMFTASDWRLVDLEFDGQNNSAIAVVINGINQITLLRLNVHNVHGAFYTNDFTPLSDQLSIQDSIVTTIDSGVPTSAGLGAWIFSQRFSFQGNSVDSGGGGEHVLRLPKLVKAVIGNNTLSHPAINKEFIKLHQANPVANQALWDGTYTEKVLIADNLIVGLAGSAWSVVIAPQNSSFDERLRDIIVERNWFQAGPGTQIAIYHTAENSTIRNNICDMTGAAFHWCVFVTQRGIEPHPNNVSVYNNTFYSASTGNFQGVTIGASATNTTVYNNLGSAPSATNPAMIIDSGTNTTQGNNLLSNSPAALFVNATPAVPIDFQLKSTSPAREVGLSTVPVFSDFFHTSRPQLSVIDIGAVEGP